MTKRNQNQNIENSVDRSFEAFLKYNKRRFKDYKKFCNSVRCLTRDRLTGESEKNVVYTLCKKWSLYIESVSEYLNSAIEDGLIPLDIPPKQFKLSHPFFYHKKEKRPISYEDSLDLILSKWVEGIIDFKQAAEICEGIITDVFLDSLYKTRGCGNIEISDLYRVLMLKVVGSSFHKLIKDSRNNNAQENYHIETELKDVDLPNLFLMTYRISVLVGFRLGLLLSISKEDWLQNLCPLEKQYLGLLGLYFKACKRKDNNT